MSAMILQIKTMKLFSCLLTMNSSDFILNILAVIIRISSFIRVILLTTE